MALVRRGACEALFAVGTWLGHIYNLSAILQSFLQSFTALSLIPLSLFYFYSIVHTFIHYFHSLIQPRALVYYFRPYLSVIFLLTELFRMHLQYVLAAAATVLITVSSCVPNRFSRINEEFTDVKGQVST